MKRRAANAGPFYPATCHEIERMIGQFNRMLESGLEDRAILKQTPRAIIAPHAGYIYSGLTANIAHRILAGTRPKRVVVIGPSHHVYFEGVSIATQTAYESPCGDGTIDEAFTRDLTGRFGLMFVPEAHQKEHSTKTQIPFIRHYLSEAEVVELIYGHIDYHTLIPILELVLDDPENAAVISSDLSHFYALEQAERLDGICLEGIDRLESGLLDQGCEACGILGIKAILDVARTRGWRSTLLDYRTSADASGDTTRVVGYVSAAIG